MDEHTAAQDTGTMLWMADYPAEGRRRFPDRVAITDDSVTIRYAELDRLSDRFAALLALKGIAPGSRVAYLGKNNALFFPVLFGCLRAGAVLVPLNWRCAAAEIAFILQDSGPALLLHDAEFAGVAAEARDQAGSSCALMTVAGPEAGPEVGTLRAWLAQDIPDDIPTDLPAARTAPDPDACAFLMYTSGTTGRPKGAMLSHRALSLSRWVEIGSPHWANWTDDDLILSAMPNFHIGGLAWMLIGLLRSLTCVLTADPSPANLLALCRSHRATRTFMVPTVVRGFVDLAETEGAPDGLRGVYYGAAVMDAPLLARCLAVLNCEFSQFFGMTENCGTISFLPADCHDPSRPELLTSVGRALPGMEITIRDPSGALCPPGRSGEIWVKAPTLMLGYWNRPDATAEAMSGGWYRTGDGGRLDGDGFLFLTDRLKDIVISGGENIYPAEVEAMLRQHPAIREVVVVGTPDPVWGEIVTALVEWRDGRSATLEDLRAFGRGRIAGYKLPKALHDAALLPRTATGKLQRGAARKLFVPDRGVDVGA